MEPRGSHDSANVVEKVPLESAQSGIDGSGKMLDERKELIADADGGSLESV